MAQVLCLCSALSPSRVNSGLELWTLLTLLSLMTKGQARRNRNAIKICWLLQWWMWTKALEWYVKHLWVATLLLLGDWDHDLGNTVDHWENNGEISLEVCLGEECRYTLCDTKTLYSSPKRNGDSMCVCVHVCAYVCVHVLESGKEHRVIPC